MKIVVTGATGFVGRHLVPCLLERGHTVVAVSRDWKKPTGLLSSSSVELVTCDVSNFDNVTIKKLANSDALIHLAWPGLPNYGDLDHIERNYVDAYRFLKSLVSAGIKQLLVTGTCFEYGLENGCLSEDHPVRPSNPYGIAKDFLRVSLQTLATKLDFQLQWARLFYMYGPGQQSNSLMAQLEHAIARGDSSFDMSGGEQIRDFTPVGIVAQHLADVLENSQFQGVVNICSGQPISVRSLVESRLKAANSNLRLNLGHYPYSPHEPFAFWGSRQKLNELLDQS